MIILIVYELSQFFKDDSKIHKHMFLFENITKYSEISQISLTKQKLKRHSAQFKKMIFEMDSL